MENYFSHSHSTLHPHPLEHHSPPRFLHCLSSPMDETGSNKIENVGTLSRTFYLSIVETIEDNLEDGDDNHADCRCDDEGVGGGERCLLLLLGPDGAGQQLVSSFDIVVFKKVTEMYVFLIIMKVFYP